MFGNKSELLTKKVDDAVTAVLQTIQQKASQNFPAAAGIVGLQYNLSELSADEKSNYITVIASGTVVVPKASPIQLSKNLQKAGSRTRKNRKDN